MTNPVDAFNDSDGLRWYRYQGKDYMSVTSMRKVLGIPYPLHNWTINQYLNAVIANPSLTEVKEEGEEAKARTAIRGAGNAERDRAAERGSDVHQFIADGHKLEEAPEELKPYIEAYASAVVKLGLKPVLSERQVFNQKRGYAGSFDVLADVHLTSERTVIDLKTGKGVYAEHALQCLSYLKGEFVAEGDALDEAATAELKKATAIAVLHLHGDGTWAYYPIPVTEKLTQAWLAMCILSGWLHANPTIKEVMS